MFQLDLVKCVIETESQWWLRGCACSESSRVLLDLGRILYQGNGVMVVTMKKACSWVVTTLKCYKSQWLASGSWLCQNWMSAAFHVKSHVRLMKPASGNSCVERSGHGGDIEPVCLLVAFHPASVLVIKGGLLLSRSGSSQGHLLFWLKHWPLYHFHYRGLFHGLEVMLRAYVQQMTYCVLLFWRSHLADI